MHFMGHKNGARSTLELQKTLLKRDMAVVSFGNQLFRISPLADLNCIRVDAEEESFGHNEPSQGLSLEVIEGCMESLRAPSGCLWW